MSIAEKLQTIAENVPKVFDAGKQALHDAFWEGFQQGGKRTNYFYAFSDGWGEDIFPPKYLVKPTNADHICTRFQGKNLTINFDLSSATNLNYAFAECQAKVIEMVDFSSATSYLYPFNACGAESISIRGINNITSFSAWFSYCYNLTTLNIEGTISASLNLSYSTKLSHDSIVGIINALSANATEKTLTLSRTAVTKAFGSTSSEAWLNLIATKSNWTISLS